VWLGNGIQNNPGGYVWDFDTAPWVAAPCLGCRLTFSDRTIESDESFRVAPSPLLMDDFRWGEVYDANRELPGWNAPGFDDGDWRIAQGCPRPSGRLVPCDCEPIAVIREIPPVSIEREPDGWRYDFGVNTAGVCRMNITGRPGQRVELYHGELLANGRFDNGNLNFHRSDLDVNVQRDVYTCRGGEECYEPVFTYHAFRYVLVKGLEDHQAVPSLLTLIEFHSALAERGRFECSDPIVNQIQEITLRSDLSCFHYFPNDCPHREKNGWTADAALSCEQMLINLAPEKSLRQWLHAIRMAQDERGALPGIVPTGGWGFAWGNGPAWDNVLFYLPYFMYQYRWDDAVLRENAHAMLRYLQYIGTKRDAEGLYAVGLGDWCPAGREADDYKAPLRVTDTILVADLAHKAAEMFAASGLTREEAFARDLYIETRAAFRQRLIDRASLMAEGACQTSQAMALFYGMFEPEETGRAFERLLELVHAADDHLDVGVLGGRVLFHVLTAYGHSELAYHLITRPDFPSYGDWVARGATTLWEEFLKEGSPTPYSRNHHFWGDVSGWFYRALGGIRVSFRRVDIRPAFVPPLTEVRCEHVTPAGTTRVHWTRDDGAVMLRVEAPKNLEGRIALQTPWRFEDGTSERSLSGGCWRCVCCYQPKS
jgi:alpha-L-rhamnosidase